ncbi:hypothetical protein A7E78_13405 [Syntrophotalea acetylenivorans]|uniref:RING-type E3 ubiquitin transferase n=1 Tax=Syntrophotalea acetylenivorans TaxID=1842532 RepID=A0A1L3GS31_9BACT|nr:GIDE domain-containing protein [Syntrophotalea acetylenivorans]APG28742.1 hypothetical protein A7E78_13405 [Syntrophotalea acetylenivorans]
MAETSLPHLLVVDSVATGSNELDSLLTELDGQPGIDLYLARQRLIGRGPNLLAEGSQAELAESANILTRRGWRCWVLPNALPRLVPTRLRSLNIEPDMLTFFTAGDEIVLERGMAVVAVLADLSGSIVGKHLKHLMAQKVYNGIDKAQPISDEDLQQAILRAKPVLDLYLLKDGSVSSAVRVLPGRFDPKGLGESMSLSATINLQRILERVQEYASTCTLALDFGLANLPGCRVEKATDGGPWEQQNLASLSRYGWLVTGLAVAGSIRPIPNSMENPTVVPGLGNVAYVGELLDEIREEMPPLAEPAPPAATAAPLPAPPPRPRKGGLSKPQLLSICGTAAGTAIFLALDNNAFAQAVLHYGIRPGLLPAALSAAFLWGGFHFLRLKRRVENTPTSKTRSLAMGLVEIHGQTRRKYALVSPMSQLPCAYYRLRKYRKDRNNRWKLTSCKESDHVPFYLEDDTGRVIIDPQRATVRPRSRQQGFGGQQSLLMDKPSHIDRDEKWIEETIAEGTRLYILGQAKENTQRRPPLRQRVIESLRELKKDPAALKRYDRNGDGQICEQEWSEARRLVEEQLLHQSLQEKGRSLPQQDRVIITRPQQRSLPFIIAETASEAHLVRSYSLYTLPLFGGAVLTVVWTVVMLVEYLRPT